MSFWNNLRQFMIFDFIYESDTTKQAPRCDNTAASYYDVEMEADELRDRLDDMEERIENYNSRCELMQDRIDELRDRLDDIYDSDDIHELDNLRDEIGRLGREINEDW